MAHENCGACTLLGTVWTNLDYKLFKFAEYCSFSHKVPLFSNSILENEIENIQKELDLLKELEKNHEKQIKKLENENNEKEKVI